MAFNKEEAIQKLKAAGLGDAIIAGMIKTMESEERRKQPREKSGKKKNWFPGMDNGSSKIEADVEVTVRCECCGHVETFTKTMTIKADSPRTQKVATFTCGLCPAFLRGLDHDVLVSLILLKEIPDPTIHGLRTPHLVRMAKKLTPEEVLVLNKKKEEVEENGTETPEGAA